VTDYFGWPNSFSIVGELSAVFECTDKFLLHTLEFAGVSYKRTCPL